jgi:uncharacterized peroxidase-related enzyme
MTKIELLSEEQASTATKELYGMLKKKVGRVPNVYQVYGHSSAALKANLMMDDALSHGELSGTEVEIVALIVSQFNNCEYCLAAHTAVGKMYGMTTQQTIDARKGAYTTSKEQALIDFTKAILNKKGKVDKEDLNEFLKTGYTNGAVVEVIGQIAKNFFNNYTNHIAGTEVDFPEVDSI